MGGASVRTDKSRTHLPSGLRQTLEVAPQIGFVLIDPFHHLGMVGIVCSQGNQLILDLRFFIPHDEIHPAEVFPPGTCVENLGLLYPNRVPFIIGNMATEDEMDSRYCLSKISLQTRTHMPQDNDHLAGFFQFRNELRSRFYRIFQGIFSFFFRRDLQRVLIGDQSNQTDFYSPDLFDSVGLEDRFARPGIHKIRCQKWELGPLAELKKPVHTEGEVQLPGGKGIISHEVVGFHVEVTLELAEPEGVRIMDGRWGIEEISGINEEKVGSLQSQPLDAGSASGQTAQEEIFSAAGLEFTMDIGRKDQGDSPLRGEGRGLPHE